MNKALHLGLPIIDISKTLVHEFWYDYIKTKYKNNAKPCSMDTDSFIIYIKTEDFYDIANGAEKTSDTSNYDVDRPLPKGKNKKVIELMKDELGGNTMVEFVAFRPKTYSYSMDDDDNNNNKKASQKVYNRKYLNLLTIRIAYSIMI